MTDSTIPDQTDEQTDEQVPTNVTAQEVSAEASASEVAEASASEVAEASASEVAEEAAGLEITETLESVAVTETPSGGEAAAPGRGNRVKQLEREGEVAADFLETLLDIADLDGDLDVDVDGDRAAVAIVDSEDGRVPRRLVGDNGKVLEALQELTRLAVQVETGERSRLMLDIAGHRAARRSALVEQATQTIAEVRRTGARRELEPMSAFERKVVHDQVAHAGLVSESEGAEPNRYVVILPE